MAPRFIRLTILRGWRLAFLLVCLTVSSLTAEESSSVEYGVKAAFLVKFGMFVEWPAKVMPVEQKQFRIGILGQDPFGASFDEAAKKEKVLGRNVEILRGQEVGELENCQLVFICASETRRLAQLLTEFSSRGILTVADQPDFAAQGGMIGFIKEAGKVRFEINLDAAEKAGLKISSKLLQLGRKVNSRERIAG